MTVIQEIDINRHPALLRLHEAAVLANEAILEHKDGIWCFQGDAVDCALLMMAGKSGFHREDVAKNYKQLAVFPYESLEKFAAGVYEKDGKVFAFVKGAVETVLAMCDYQADKDGFAYLDEKAITHQQSELSNSQYRVLSFAFGEIDKKQEYSKDDLKRLTFLGMTGLRDPLREEAISAINDCHRAGIKVVMITGDHPDTAFAIARELSLTDNKDEVVTGQQLHEASQRGERVLDKLVQNSKVYARVEPSQKLDIVDSLIRNGQFVAVTGDGVNDAPALRHAHVGVAMGEKGTDVARESAEILLTDDNFASIVYGIEEGRVVYANIRKIVFFLISTAVAEVFMFLTAILLGLPIPLYATQLLWINFATSIIQDIALAFDPAQGNELKHPPRNPREFIFDRLMITRILVTAAVMGLICLVEFYWMLNHGNYTAEDARNIVLLQFILFENIVALNSQSETSSFFNGSVMKNPLLIYGTLAAQAMHLIAMYTPGLSDALYIHPVGLVEWLVLLACAMLVMSVIELEKWLRRTFSNASTDSGKS